MARNWKCRVCDRVVSISYEDLVEIGVPICCDEEMELQPEAPTVRKAEKLSRDELLHIVTCLQGYLYLDLDSTGNEFLNPDKEWDCADVCESLAGLLSEHGLVPE